MSIFSLTCPDVGCYQNFLCDPEFQNKVYQDMQGVVQNNVQFYNDILSSAQNFDFYYFTPGRIWDASGYYVTVIGDPVVTADLNTYQMAEVTVNWVSKVNPLPYEFDTDTFLEGLYYIISSTGYTGDVWTSNCTSSEEATFSAVLNVGAISGAPALVWSVDQADGSDDITDIGLTFVDNDLQWDATGGNGVYIFTVTVTNEYGCVFGQQTITLTVDCEA